MSDVNRHGLRRAIPLEIKRQVRKECGFGCVVCGGWICEYDHFDPEFQNAKSHDPDGIALLCGSHHGAKTKGLLTNEQVRSYRDNPYNVQNGLRNNALFFATMPTLFLCGNEIVDGGSVVANLRFTSPFRVTRKQVGGTGMAQQLSLPIVNIGRPTPEEPIPIYVSLYDSEKSLDPIFRIKDNEWSGNIDVFDIESVGPNITIRRRKGEIVLGMDLDPKNSRIDISNIAVTLPGMKLKRFYDPGCKEYGVDCNGLRLMKSQIRGKVKLVTTLRNAPGDFEIVTE